MDPQKPTSSTPAGGDDSLADKPLETPEPGAGGQAPGSDSGWQAPAGQSAPPTLSDEVNSSELFSAAPAGAAGMVTPPKAKKKGLIWGLVIAGLVLLLGGGAVAAYYGYYVPNQPDNILKTALVNAFSKDKYSSVYFEGKADVKNTSEDMTLAATLEGKGNRDGAFQMTAEVDLLVTNVTLDLRSVDGSTYYLRLGGLSGLPELLQASGDPTVEAYAPLITGLDDQWFEINKSLLEQLGSNVESTTLSDADLQKLADIYSRHTFLKVAETLPDETIKGMASYHYRVTVDKAELKAALTDLKNANIAAMEITQESLDELNALIDQADFNKYPFDIWISKDGKLIDQLSMSVSEGDTSFSVQFTFFDFNKSVSVEKPDGAKSLLDVLGSLETSSGVGSDVPDNILQQLEGGGISL